VQLLNRAYRANSATVMAMHEPVAAKVGNVGG